MESTLELATFRGNDEPCLVEAALACRACLSGDVEWSLMVDEFEGEVECRCRDCGYARIVSLTSEQTLRLSLQPACVPRPVQRGYGRGRLRAAHRCP